MATPRSLLVRLAPAALLLAVLLLAAGALAAAYEKPGPARDGSGNLVDDEWMMRAAIHLPYKFSLLDATSGIERVVPDDGYTASPVPLNHGIGDPFVFDFYGEQISEVHIHGEGFLSDVVYAYTPITNTGTVPEMDGSGLPSIMIAPFWSNWEMTDCGGRVFTNVTGDPGSRIFTVQWTNMVHVSQRGACTTGGFPAYHTFQAQLHEGTNNIMFAYQYAQSDYLGNGFGSAVTVGVRNDQPRWSDGSTTPLHLQWGTGIGGDTKLTMKMLRFYPNHAPRPLSMELGFWEDDEPQVFYLPSSDDDGDSISEYRITAGTISTTFPADPTPNGVAPMELRFGTVDCKEAPKCVFTPREHHYGTQIIQYQARDQMTFAAPCAGSCVLLGSWGPPGDVPVTVRPINDRPSFTLSGPAVVPQSGNVQQIPDWIQDIRPGPLLYTNGTAVGAPFDESIQNITFQVQQSNPSWFIVPPKVLADGTLEMIARETHCGSMPLTVRAQDNGGTTFLGVDASPWVVTTLTIECFANDPPFFDQSLNETRQIDQGDAFSFDASTLPIRDDHHWPGEPELVTVRVVEQPSRGHLWLAGAPLPHDANFTLKDIVDNLVEYQSDGITAGLDTIRLEMTDGYGKSAEEEIWIEMIPVANPPPVAERILGLTLQENQTRTIDTSQLSYNDGIGSAPVDLNFIVTVPPVLGDLMVSGIPAHSFTQEDLVSGRLQYVNHGGPPGPDPFQFEVRDLQGAKTSPRTFRIDVLPANSAPEPASDIIDRDVLPGESLSFTARASDLEGDSYTCTLEGDVPTGARIDADTCHFRFRPSVRQIGTYAITIRFEEDRPGGEVSLKTILVTVQAPPDASQELVDTDRDGIPDMVDNCRYVPNHNQLDLDRNELGDLCDPDFTAPDAGAPTQYSSLGAVDLDFPDSDQDGIMDGVDNCRNDANHHQEDGDGDGIGDACDEDFDNDGVPEAAGLDNCPDIANTDQADLDGDGIGDVCDEDLDGDDVTEARLDEGAAADNCPAHHNPEQEDADGDGTGDACDPTPMPVQEAAVETKKAALWPWMTAGGAVLLAVAGVVAWRMRRD